MSSAISAQAGVSTFRNTGEITSEHDDTVSVSAGIDSFFNSGSIVSQTGHALNVGDYVASFTNAGNIQTYDHAPSGVANDAVIISGGIGAFSNSGNIEANANSVIVYGDIGDFTNSGTLTSHETSDGLELHGSITGTFRNTGSGQINAAAEGVYVGIGAVNTFINDAGGSIHGDDAGVYLRRADTASFANAGDISGGNEGAMFDESSADSFRNEASGRIWAGASGYGVKFTSTVSSFYNSGSIYGGYGGVTAEDNVSSFVNAGSITGFGAGIYFPSYHNASVGSFTNSGTIEATDPTYGEAILTYLPIGSFTNEATGHILGPFVGVDATSSTITSFVNAGYIRGTSYVGVALYADPSQSTTLINSGTIEGDTGVLYEVGGNGAQEFLTNSGTIRSLSGGLAIDFDCGCSYESPDTLTLLTGSKIFGTVQFTRAGNSNDPNDTLDFSGFAGNTVLDVPGLDLVVPGSRGYVWDKPNDKIAIFDLSGFDNRGLGADWNAIAQAMFETSRTQMEDWSALNPQSGGARTNYAALPDETAAQQATETAVMTDLDTTRHLGLRGWASLIGGGSGGAAVTDRTSLYGGIVAGSHARLSQMLTLGAMAGVVQSSSSTLSGDELLNSSTGSLGLYGSAQFGVADVDFSLIAGLSLNQSNRKVVAGGTTETAVGTFTSGVLTPSVVLSVPVLSTDGGSVALEAGASYSGGLVSGYSETGSSMNLTVGAQTIAVVDARFGLSAKSLITTTGGATYALTARAGLLATSNFGSSSVPVTVFGQTVQLSTPGSTAYGAYAGLGVEGAVNDNLRLGLNLDTNWRTDRNMSAAAKFSVTGSF